MKILPILSILILCCNTLKAQDDYDEIAGTFILDSITISAERYGSLNPVDFIRLSMEDTSLFHAFSMLKRIPYKMQIERQLYDKKNRKTAYSFEEIHQLLQDNCRWQVRQHDSIQGQFYDKKGRHLSETDEMFRRIFTIDKRTCDLHRQPKAPEGIVMLNKPRDVKQQKELIRRMIFAPHTVRVEVPLFGNKMKTDIFSKPTSDYYHFKVTRGYYDNFDPVYIFEITVDSTRYPNWEKDVLIKSMRTCFRIYDMKILERSYVLFYPGSMASCDLSIMMKMTDIENNILPKKITYSGRWKFPTKGTDISDITINFFDLQTEGCTH
jgi:hypothetical protein